MTAVGNISNFTTVDSAPDATWFIDFMDLANSLPQYGRIRSDLAEGLGHDLCGRTILEVGCGTGDDARELSHLVGPAGKVVITDPSDTMLQEARRRGSGRDLPVEYRSADLRALPFADASFDGARAKLVLMHCDDIEAGLDELVRVLRTGGRLSAYDYDFDTMVIDHPDRDATREVIRAFSDGHRNNWSGRQLARRYRERGMRDIVVRPHTVVMPFHFFEKMTAGRLASAQAAGSLALSREELAAWWLPLAEAQSRGTFFASFAGFVVSGARA
jgi:ubiquinone/menaquinone biosynthesis C-methylase UbiE